MSGNKETRGLFKSLQATNPGTAAFFIGYEFYYPEVFSMKSLVVYYSRTGNTRFVAEKIAEVLRADLEELIDKKDRRGAIGWLSAGMDASLNRETEIGQTRHSPSGYDLVVLGVPVWDLRVPPAMRTYLNRNDLSKKIALFCTNAGSSAENTLSSLITLARNQNPLAQLVVSKVLKNPKQAESKVENWCKELIASMSKTRRHSAAKD